MVYCTSCECEVKAEEDYQAGYSFCRQCGTVLEEGTYQNDVEFNEGGQRIGTYFSNDKDGDDPALAKISSEKGESEISLIVDHLRIYPRQNMIECAGRLYKMAVHRGFLCGRRANQVAACCIYIMCRHDKKPYMLIDFSDALRINVYVLGSVFLDITTLFSLDENPIITSPVDPCLYIHRYVEKFNFGKHTSAIIRTSINLIKGMNREWIQTGRKPAGVIGAAIYIASHIHGVPKLRSDIVHVVHIGISTVGRRLIEFSKTRSAKLTHHEFEKEAQKFQEMEDNYPYTEQKENTNNSKFYCHHIEKGIDEFHKGMCKECYIGYISLSGHDYKGFSDPPCIQRKERKRKKYKSIGKMLQILKDFDKNYENIDFEKEIREMQNVHEIDYEMQNILSSKELKCISESLQLSPVTENMDSKCILDESSQDKIEKKHSDSSNDKSTLSAKIKKHQDEEESDIPFDEDDMEDRDIIFDSDLDIYINIDNSEKGEVKKNENFLNLEIASPVSMSPTSFMSKSISEKKEDDSDSIDKVLGNQEENCINDINGIDKIGLQQILVDKYGNDIEENSKLMLMTKNKDVRIEYNNYKYNDIKSYNGDKEESEQIPFDDSDEDEIPFDEESVDDNKDINKLLSKNNTNGKERNGIINKEIEQMDNEIQEPLLSDEEEDLQVDNYFMLKEEAIGKRNIWMLMNKEFIEKQKQEPKLDGKIRKKRLRKIKEKEAPKKQHTDVFEAVKEMLEERGLSKKINYKNLKKLLSEGSKSPSPEPQEKSKQQLQYERELEARHMVGLNAERRGPRGLDGEYLSHLSFRKHLPKKNPKRLQGLYS